MALAPDLLIVSESAAATTRLVHVLEAAGVRSEAEAAAKVPGSSPIVVVVGDDAIDRIVDLRSRWGPRTPILAAVSAPMASRALELGASDTIDGSDGSVIVARCKAWLRCWRAEQAADSGQLLRQVAEALSTEADEEAALTTALRIVAGALGFPRASLLAHVPRERHAYVIAATDSPGRAQFTVDVADYPEVEEALRSGQPLYVANVEDAALTAPIAGRLVAAGVRSLAVFPVPWRGRAIGAILLRSPEPKVAPSDSGIATGCLLASSVGAFLRQSAAADGLREPGRRLAHVAFQTERRLRSIASLRQHFESGTDGVVVLDESGRVLFANPAAGKLAGVPHDDLIGTELAQRITEADREVLLRATRKVLSGGNVGAFDLQLVTAVGTPAWASVSTSTVLAEAGAVILTFRDVTSERQLQLALRATKEFLERLIDSTVDAIIAADLRGSILLFNRGAERLFGYSAGEVIGRKPVWELYEPGVAKQIMHMLRSGSSGGAGRLEQSRREVRDKDGVVVPVNLSASLIYDEGRHEVASVGVLTDLRERIGMEQRLLEAQHQLQISEKQAGLAELAGAAAHELNQPLTSIMGYAELLRRQSPDSAVAQRALGIILEQAERMAGIVKKIGRITKYETVDYIGGARVLDLDRAAPSDGGLVIPDPPTEAAGEEQPTTANGDTEDESTDRRDVPQ